MGWGVHVIPCCTSILHKYSCANDKPFHWQESSGQEFCSNGRYAHPSLSTTQHVIFQIHCMHADGFEKTPLLVSGSEQAGSLLVTPVGASMNSKDSCKDCGVGPGVCCKSGSTSMALCAGGLPNAGAADAVPNTLAGPLLSAAVVPLGREAGRANMSSAQRGHTHISVSHVWQAKS